MKRSEVMKHSKKLLSAVLAASMIAATAVPETLLAADFTSDMEATVEGGTEAVPEAETETVPEAEAAPETGETEPTVESDEGFFGDDNFDESSISAVKTSLMGPIAGIGDSLIWGTLLTIAVGISTSLASKGSIMGPILFVLIINVPGFLLRYYCLKVGYSSGTKFFATVNQSGLINRITKVACVLGLLVVGSMIAQQVSITTPLMINVSGMETPVQDYFDQIMPCFLPACAFGLMYWLLSKKVKSTTILICLVIFGCLTAALGIL